VASTRVEDVGVAAFWRLMDRLEEIRRHPVVVAVAGMEGALFSVLGARRRCRDRGAELVGYGSPPP